MRKEILFAIILGLAVGLLITYGVYRSRQAVTPDPTLTLGPSPSPTADIENIGNLTLSSPEDEIIVTESEVSITGTTTPQAFVVIFVNEDERITTADSSGNFSVSADLETGSNVITVYALDEDGQKSTQERVVTYITEPLLEASPAATNSGTTDETSQEDEDA